MHLSSRRRFVACFAALLVCSTALAEIAPRPPRAETVRLVFTGDIMLDMFPGATLSQGVDPFAHYADVFREADLVVGNLECVVTTGGRQFRKPYTFRVHPRAIPVLDRWFDAFSIANNHTGDFGDEALLEELELFAGKIPLFGGGRNLAEARKPWLVERNGVRIAILGYNEFIPKEFAAGENDPGVAWGVDEHVLADLRAAREIHKADVVIPFMHWGSEYEPQADDRQKQFARAMIDAGASAVIGAHAHVTQGAEIYNDRPIIYSLGNFVFDGFEEPEANVGWVLRLTIDRQGIVNWDTVVHDINFIGTPTPNWSATGPAAKRGDSTVTQRVPDRPNLTKKVDSSTPDRPGR
ncbi:Capsule biosynthesis protein CapA [Caulifigura coniformis]|uniref:Capsule biosynthesis protein CapA n=1 Tax=Caulifigura coniformis TaxID=2527983 RepID=A0A517SIR2_9PLAN|nr:CapA family protein [Caulifigura coniformis]QDT56021.1 Capsule biosynthesis protein CapA [Caulifigura coniformis]